jgi:DNA-binding CsgD family transcriptional regulator
VTLRLSPREHRVISLVADGLTNHEVSRDLAISEETVKDHMKSILYKLNARNRAHAVAIAYRQGLLE